MSIYEQMTRRYFFGRSSLGVGTFAAAGLFGQELASAMRSENPGHGGVLKAFHHPPRARRIVYLFMSGGPSQMDLFDYKPRLNRDHGLELPASVRRGQRLTGMSGNQASLPIAGSVFKFRRHGQSGAWLSELLPHTAKVVDELCVIKSVYTEAINHDPAITYIQTGSQIAGRPSLGAWLDYGLGSTNENLPSFCVMVTKNKGGQPLYARLWGSGFLPASHQGVQLRAGRDPVLYLTDAPGISRAARRKQLDRINELHHMELEQRLDPAIEARIAQSEMAFRMQASIPEVANIADEPQHVLDRYGPDVTNPGTFAANCLLARRLLERDVRCVQLFHKGWDQHGGLPAAIRRQCLETDRPAAALIHDLRQRGLLEDTLVVWGGEFGRTAYSQGKLTANNYGRDHHPRCFTMWMAGGGVRAGVTIGKTDEYSYNIVERPVHIHDLNATILHLLGIDHERLTFRYQGRRYRLTDVHGEVVHEVLA
ncbi:MAG: sulfatase [Pirellulaceae bacterium]|nr:MAG: sulfatase [Pirellulaceae bacterium]